MGCRLGGEERGEPGLCTLKVTASGGHICITLLGTPLAMASWLPGMRVAGRCTYAHVHIHTFRS